MNFNHNDLQKQYVSVDPMKSKLKDISRMADIISEFVRLRADSRLFDIGSRGAIFLFHISIYASIFNTFSMIKIRKVPFGITLELCAIH